jgi:IMP dehydrogenase/GMP reductase
MFKALLFLGIFAYIIYRFGRKIYQIARIIAGVGDAIAKKQQRQSSSAPYFQDSENNVNIHYKQKQGKKDFNEGEYVDYEEVK